MRKTEWKRERKKKGNNRRGRGRKGKKEKRVEGEGIRVGGKGWLVVLRGMDAAGP